MTSQQQQEESESAARRHWHKVNLHATFDDIASQEYKAVNRPLDYPTTHFDIAVQPKVSTIIMPTITTEEQKMHGEFMKRQMPNVLHGVHRLERGYLLEREEARGRFGIVFVATVLRGEKRGLRNRVDDDIEAVNSGLQSDDEWNEDDERFHHQKITRVGSVAEDDEVTWHATTEKAAVKVVQCHDLPTAMAAPQDGHIEDHHTGYNHPLLEIASTRLVGGGYTYYEQVLGYIDCRDDKFGEEVSPTAESAIQQKSSFDNGIHNVTRLLDAYVDKTHIFMALPYYTGGELFHKVQKKGRFDEIESRYWFKQILYGLSTFHARGMCHLDLSLENIMIDFTDIADDDIDENLGRAVIIDLGSSLRVPFHARPPSSDQSNGLVDDNNNNASDKKDRYDVVNGGLRRLLAPLPSTVGKIPYLPPECLPSQQRQREPFDPFAVDLWAAAIMLYTMLAGKEPWNEANSTTDHRFRMAQKHGGVGALLRVLDITWLSEEVIELLDHMLHEDPRERMSLGAVLEHPWVTKS